MKKTILLTLSALVVIGPDMVRADVLKLGSVYNTIHTSAGTVGGGSLGGAPNLPTLNGKLLPWVYCVDFWDHVGVPATYNNATVTNNGTIAGSAANSSGLVNYTGPAGTLTAIKNVNQVAWLLHNFAAGAVGNTANQIGLQGSIWNVIYGITLTGGNSPASVSAYTGYLTALNTANSAGPLANYVDNYRWVSPGGAGNTPVRQGLVTQVPDGGMTLILLGGALAAFEALRRKICA